MTDYTQTDDYIPFEYAGMTNEELLDRFGEDASMEYESSECRSEILKRMQHDQST